MQRFDPETTADLKALSTPSDVRGAAQALGHLGLIVAAGAVVWLTRDSLWVLPALLAEGIALVFLFCALHEAVHYTPFASRRLNQALAWLCGVALLIPPRWFRHFHLAHHRWTQDPRRDPELAAPKPRGRTAYLLHLSGLPLWKGTLSTLLGNAAGRRPEGFVPAREHAAVAGEARIMVTFYALIVVLSLAFQSWAAIWLWLLPLLAGQPLLRLYLLAEHTGCPEVADMLRNSRTTRTGPLLRFLAWNMPYHAEHHAWPAAPFHALPQVHALIGERVEMRSPSYRAASAEVMTALGARAPRPDPTAG